MSVANWVTYKPPRLHKPRAPRSHVPTGHASDWGLAPGHQAPGTVVYGGGQQHPTQHAAAGPNAPLTDAQIQAKALALVRAGVDPQIAAANASAAARASAGFGQIQGLTQALAGNLGQYLAPIGAAYEHAQAQQGAVNTALADRLNAVGQGEKAGLAQTLGAANLPNAAAVSNQADAVGQGASNAGFATGSAELSRLIANAASAKEYVAKQPGIAALTGLRYGRDFGAQVQKGLADETRQIEAGVPGAVANMYQTLLQDERVKETQRFNQAIAKARGLLDTQKTQSTISHQERQDRIAAAKLGLSYKDYLRKQAHDRATAAHNRRADTTSSRKADIAGQNAVTGSSRAAEQARAHRVAEAQRRRAQRDTNRRQTQWRVDSKGNIIYRVNPTTGKRERVPLPKKKSKSSGGDGLGP